MKRWRAFSTTEPVAGKGTAHFSFTARLGIDEEFFAVLVCLRTAASVKVMASWHIKIAVLKDVYHLDKLSCVGTEGAAQDFSRATKSSDQVVSEVQLVIDCTELSTKRPSGLMARK